MEYSFSNSLGNLTSRLTTEMRAVFVRLLSEQQIDITTDEWFVVSKLYHTSAIAQNEIAADLGITKVQVTRLIAQLEHKKLILRNTVGIDKRAKQVCLTPEGIELYERIKPIAAQVHVLLFDGFDSKEIQTYLALSNRILQNLKK